MTVKKTREQTIQLNPPPLVSFPFSSVIPASEARRESFRGRVNTAEGFLTDPGQAGTRPGLTAKKKGASDDAPFAAMSKNNALRAYLEWQRLHPTLSVPMVELSHLSASALWPACATWQLRQMTVSVAPTASAEAATVVLPTGTVRS